MKLTPVDLTELEALITQSEALTAKAVRRVTKRVASDIQDAGMLSMAAAGPGSSSAEPPSTPPFGALSSLYQYWSEVLSDLFSPFIVKAWHTGVDAAMKDIHVYAPEWEAPTSDPLMLENLQASVSRVQGLSAEIWQHAQDEMMAGVQAGDSIHQMASRVSASAGLSIPHAQSIVRTEVIAAANAGSADLIALAGFTGTQQWLATNDPKTRITHKKADGQVVAIGEMFTLGEMWKAPYPGASSLPPGERINCRCSVAYDLDDESIVAALIAAGKGFNELHPRDSKGKFVKKDLLGLLKHNATSIEINHAIDNMTATEWHDLTPTQQKAIEHEVALSGNDASIHSLNIFKSIPPPDEPKPSSSLKLGPVKKITHKDIHSPKGDYEALAVAEDGTAVVWDPTKNKYVAIAPDGKQTALPKSKVYDFMQGKTWHEPAKSTPPAPEPMKQEDLFPAKFKAAKKGAKKGVKKAVKKVVTPPAKAEPKFLEKTKDFSNFDKQGGQLGSNQGAMFISAEGGEKWYIKKAKSEKHASNEVAASMFYTLGGIDAPFVNKGSGAPGIGGGLQTGTKVVPGAKSDLATKIKSDPAYLKEIQKGFVMDAWLANWDVAGLSYDNIVTGADGKPHRIDVGGAMLYRAQGTPKGAAFGDTVVELETMRSPNHPQANAVFGSMTDDDIRESAKHLEEITPEMIDKVVKDSGLPSSVADTLKKRREFILAKYGSDKTKLSDGSTITVPEITTIDADKFKTTPPDDPDWDALANDIKVGVYSPNTIVAENGDGDYIEINDLNEAVLYNADGEVLETADSMDIEDLTKNSFGWSIVDKSDELGEPDPTPLPAPGGSDMPSKIGVFDVPATIDGKKVEQVWSHTPESDNGSIGFVTSDGTIYVNGKPGKPVIPTGWHVGNLEGLSFKKEWPVAAPAPSTLPAPGAPSLPETVNGITIPKVVADTNGVVNVKEVHATSTDVYLVDENDVVWHKPKNSNSVKMTTPKSGIIGKFGLKKLDGSHVDTTLKPAAPSVSTSTVPGASLPYHVKYNAKTTMKSHNLGYWSKPEKIWDAVLQIQASHPDPANPGQSKYSPLQILEALDSQLKTTKPNPYTEKMKKWALTPAGKAHAKSAMTPSVTSVSPVKGAKKAAAAATPSVTDPDVKTAIGDADITMYNEPYKKTIFEKFKNGGSSYLSSPDDMKWASYQTIAAAEDLSVLQVVKMVDEQGAKKAGVPNGNLFEKKLLTWAKTKQGTAKITGKTPPTPTSPAYKDPTWKSSIPTKADSDHMKFPVVPYAKAVQLQAAAEAKHGAITTAEKAGLKHFTGGNYTSINHYLRGESDYISDNDQKHYLNAQKGFRPSVEPMVLHRGVGWNALGFGSTPTEAQVKALIGKKGTHKGFSSTSVGGKAAFGGPLLLVMEAPTGTPMAFVDPYSKNKGENEMLLPAGTDFEIIAVEHYGGSSGYGQHGATRVRVRIVP